MTESLNDLWRADVMVKVIARKLGISTHAVRDRVQRARAKEGPEKWPYRNSRFGNGKDPVVSTGVTMPEALLKAANQRARDQGMTVSAYIRQLLEEDLSCGTSPTNQTTTHGQAS